MRLVCFLLVIILFNSGCAGTWKKVTPEIFKEDRRQFEVQLPLGWMQYNGNEVFVATRDGIELDVIKVQRAAFNMKFANTKKQFMPGMLPDELAQVLIDNYSSDPEYQKFEVISNEATKVDGNDAFCLKYRLQYKNGLWKQGIRYGYIYKNTVYLISFEAAQQHYYEATSKDFDGFMRTYKHY